MGGVSFVKKKLLRINKDGLDSLNVGLLSHSLHSSPSGNWGGISRVLRLTTGFFFLCLFLIWIVWSCNSSAFGRKSFFVARPLGISESSLYFLLIKKKNNNKSWFSAEAWNAQCTGGKSTIRVRYVFCCSYVVSVESNACLFFLRAGRGVDDGWGRCLRCCRVGKAVDTEQLPCLRHLPTFVPSPNGDTSQYVWGRGRWEQPRDAHSDRGLAHKRPASQPPQTPSDWSEENMAIISKNDNWTNLGKKTNQ